MKTDAIRTTDGKRARTRGGLLAAAAVFLAAPAWAAEAPAGEPAVSAYVCLSNSCSAQKMLPKAAEAAAPAAARPQAAAAPGAVTHAAVMDIIGRITNRALAQDFSGGLEAEIDIPLPSVNDGKVSQ